MGHTTPLTDEYRPRAESRVTARGLSIRDCRPAALQASCRFRIKIAKGIDLNSPSKEPPQNIGRLDWWRWRSESLEPGSSKRINPFVYQGRNLCCCQIGGGYD